MLYRCFLRWQCRCTLFNYNNMFTSFGDRSVIMSLQSTTIMEYIYVFYEVYVWSCYPKYRFWAYILQIHPRLASCLLVQYQKFLCAPAPMILLCFPRFYVLMLLGLLGCLILWGYFASVTYFSMVSMCFSLKSWGVSLSSIAHIHSFSSYGRAEYLFINMFMFTIGKEKQFWKLSISTRERWVMSTR